MKRIYLDHNATTPIHSEVFAKMLPYFTDNFGNPSSIHSAGRKAKEGIDIARRYTAELIEANFSEIIFTSGGSESNNLAITGTLFNSTNADLPHLITTNIEHSSVYQTSLNLTKKSHAEVSYLSPNVQGQFSLDEIRQKIQPNTKLISIMLANNETGHLFELKNIIQLAHQHNILVHIDAIQAIGKLPISVKDLDVDLLSLSGHKINAPKGIGALYIRKGLLISPIIFGGSQEYNFRAGTSNVTHIVGLGEACKIVKDNLSNQRHIELNNKRLHFYSLLAKAIPNHTLNTPLEQSLPNTLNISFLGLDSHSLLVHLDRKGVDISVGSACNAGTISPSRTLLNFRLSLPLVTSAVRLSIGYQTTIEELEQAVPIIKHAVEKLRQ